MERPEKKMNRIYFSDKEDKFSDVGSTRSCSDFSEGSIPVSSKRKANEAKKDRFIKGKNSRNSSIVHRAQHTAENLNQFYSAPPRALTPPPISNEALKNSSNAPSKSINCARTKKKNACVKRTVMPSYHKEKSLTQQSRNKLSHLKSDAKCVGQTISRCSSLTDVREKEKVSSVLSPPSLGSEFSLPQSEVMNFEKSVNSNRQKFDYMKEFDLIRNSSLFSQWEKSLWPSQKRGLAVVPNLSVPPKPFTLRRRTYSCGILSINDSLTSSSPTEKAENKKKLNEAERHESDDSDDYYSSEDSDLCDSLNNSVFQKEESKNENVVESSSSVLILKEPIRIKYIDETTDITKELLIYSNKFLENALKDNGGTASKPEVLESVLQQSVDYKGESVRVIQDTEKFFNDFKDISKFGRDIKTVESVTDDKENSPEDINKTIKSQKKAYSAPCWHKIRGNTPKKEPISKLKNPVTKRCYAKRNATNKTDGVQLSAIKICSSSRINTPDVKHGRKQSGDFRVKQEDEKNEVEEGGKSRNTLKRVNIEEVIASGFRSHFQFYAKLGGRLKSGAVISRTNSHFWLKKSGIIFDDSTLRVADDCFTVTARKKLVLNIRDYMQYLVAMARKQRMFLADVIEQLMSIDQQCVTNLNDELETSYSTKELKPMTNSLKSEQQNKLNSSSSSELTQRKS